MELLAQHGELARLKENAVAEQQFELAARKVMRSANYLRS